MPAWAVKTLAEWYPNGRRQRLDRARGGVQRRAAPANHAPSIR